MIIITGGRKRKGSHCYESLIPKRKASPQRRRPDPFFLFLLRYPLSSVSSFYLYYLPIFPPPFRFFHILSLFPVPVSSLCLCFVPLHPPPFSMLSRPLRTTCRSVTRVLTANSGRIQTPRASGSLHLCPPNMYLLSRLEPEVLCLGQIADTSPPECPQPCPPALLAQQALPWTSIPHSSTPA